MPKLKNVAVIMFYCLSAHWAFAEREWPDNQFECQVVTESGARGLVSLQTFTRQDAMQRVVGLQALNDQEVIETAVSVVQCIDFTTDEKFFDAAFQGWRNGLAE